MVYLKLLETFLLRTIFNDGEYKITSKKFNPLKVIVVTILTSGFVLSIFLLYKINTIYDNVNRHCPTYFIERQKEKVTKDSILTLEEVKQ